MLQELDDWLLGQSHAARPKGGSFFMSGGSRKGKKKPLKPGSGLANLRAAALKQPEVMVKIPKRSGASTGLKGIRNHLDYISRNGEVELTTGDGSTLNGRTAVREWADHWRRYGIREQSNKREALNIVLSMPPGTPPDAVKNAAAKFAAEQFADHDYVFALHTDSDRPSEPEHPHIHLCVLMRDAYGHRLNPRKNDLFEWRVRFAEKLREEGVECAATRRQHRGVTVKGKKTAIRAMKDRGAGNRSWIIQKQAQSLAEALQNHKRPNHAFLKQAMETRGIIVGEYGKIAKELYKMGYKTEARLIAKLAKDVQSAGFDTRAQQEYDRQSQTHGINPASSYLNDMDNEPER